MINTKLKSFSFLAFIGLVMVFILISIDKATLDNHRVESQQHVKDKLNQVSNRLRFNLYNNIQIAKGLPALFAANPSLSNQDFALAVDYLFGEHTQLRNIVAAPDLIIKYVYPVKGNEEVIDLDYRTLPLQIASVMRAKESRHLVLTGPLTLVQGGTGVISRIPVYLNKPTGEEYFWGIVAAVIDADSLYQSSGLMDNELAIDIAIRSKDDLGGTGDTFWGSSQLFDQDNIRSTITLPSGSWELVARPINGWGAKPEGMFQLRLINVGVALLLFLAIFSFLKALMNASNANLRFHTIFEEAPLGVAVIDSLTGHIYDANPAYAHIAGRPIEELKTLDWMKITHPDDVQKDLDNMMAMNAGEVPGFVMQKRYIQPDGTIRWVNMTVAPMQVEDASKPRHLCMTEDISERKIAEDKLTFMANYDLLTQLPNRELFADRFQQAAAHSKRTGTQVAICFLDLDNFKPINDNYGHNVGDGLLVEVAKRIKECIREGDTVSRQGGDEFTLLLSDIENYEQCEQTLDRIHLALSQPYLIAGCPCNITASSGVTLYPADNVDMDTLIRHADQAMYQSKLAGKHRYQLFNPQYDKEVIEAHHQLSEIKQALSNKEFKLFYQPKVNMRTGQVFGAEALIRWIHPEKGLIPPLDFLPLIEGTDLEIQVGGWVINEALQQLDSWQQEGLNLEVSINVSSHHLQSPVFFDQLEEALIRYPDVPPQELQLEILESSNLGDINIVSDIIQRCQNELGLTVALDDFGTGYSSLTHLRSLSANTIKIDQTFVHSMLENSDDLALIEGIISLAKTFGLDVIAEGVETTEHGTLLMRIGCDCAQGYGIARPMPAADMIDWVGCFTPDEAWLIWSDSDWEMSNLPLMVAQSDHIKWVEEIFNALDGHTLGLGQGELTSHSECRLGNWYYNHGEKHYGHLDAFRALEEIHIDVHKTGRRIIQLYNDGKREEAVLLVEDLLTLKSQVLDSLNTLQKQVNFAAD